MTSLDTTVPAPLAARSLPAAPPAGAPASARLLFALLAKLARGDLLVHTPAGTTHRFGAGAGRDPAGGRGEFAFGDWRLPRDVLTGGDLG
jgi:hypothetical protein